MDMKRILQAFDSASTSTKAVEGANDMAKFLRVVKENTQPQAAQSAGFQSPYPKFASITQAPDGTFTVTYLRPNIATSGTDLDGQINPPISQIPTYEKAKEIVVKDYNQEASLMTMPSPIQVKETTRLSKLAGIQENTSAVPAMPSVAGMQPGTAKDLGDGEKLTLNQDGTVSYSGAWGTYVYNAQGQHVRTDSPSFAGYQQSTNPQGQVTNQSYNMGPLSVQQGQQGSSASYDLGVAKVSQQTNAQGQTTNTVQEGDMSKFLSIIDKNDVEFLMEGANPHKVSLPVQMAMQHYTKPASATPAKKESLLKKYFAEAEEAIIEKKLEKSNLVKQYSQKIAARVLESKDKDVAENIDDGWPRDEKIVRKDLAALQPQLEVAEQLFSQARKITTAIKYDDTALGIITQLQGLITKKTNIDQRSFEMAVNDVHKAMQDLETAVYNLDNPFEEIVKDIRNKVDDLESELNEIEYKKKFGRGI